MSPFQIAIIMLDGLIAGMESGSSIPVQLSELKTLQILLTTPDKE